MDAQIKRYQSELYDMEPNPGHHERFKQRLAQLQKKKQTRIHPIIKYASAAAVILMCLWTILFVFQPKKIETDSFSEVRNYYNMQFENEVSAVEVLLERMNEEDRRNLKKDIEVMQQELKNDMNTTCSENIPCMISFYSVKINALKHVQQLLSGSIINHSI